MYALFWLLPLTLMLAGGGLMLFLWCVRSGQFEDLDGAAWRILQDDIPRPPVRREEPSRQSSGCEAHDRQS
jgi:cbb3-type cytochrome oxidase maturation protein